MSVATQISRIQANRNTIRDKMTSLGLAGPRDKLDTLASAIDGIADRGAVAVQIMEGDTYTIPQGYHNGGGTVSGIPGGGNYTLQSKSAAPARQQQSITPDAGYYGLSGVTVEAIPQQYQDVSTVTAAASDVLEGKAIVTAAGTVQGAMADNGAVSKVLTPAETSYTVPEGYHSGGGSVFIDTESKTVTPASSEQVISPAAGKVLRQVTVEAIPDRYTDTSSATAAAGDILAGKTAYAAGEKVTGTMTDNGAVSKALTAGAPSYTIPAGYHNGEGAVSVSLETKSATPSGTAQTVTPSEGKLLASVTVAAIPAAWQEVSSVTAAAGDVLEGKTIVTAAGTVQGTMADNGAVSGSIDGLNATSYAVPAGYTSGGTISLTGDIEAALAAI